MSNFGNRVINEISPENWTNMIKYFVISFQDKFFQRIGYHYNEINWIDTIDTDYFFREIGVTPNGKKVGAQARLDVKNNNVDFWCDIAYI